MAIWLFNRQRRESHVVATYVQPGVRLQKHLRQSVALD